MIIYMPKIWFPYDDTYTMIGVYSTIDKAQIAITKELDHYQKITSRTNDEIKDIRWYIDDYEVE